MHIENLFHLLYCWVAIIYHVSNWVPEIIACSQNQTKTGVADKLTKARLSFIHETINDYWERGFDAL